MKIHLKQTRAPITLKSLDEGDWFLDEDGDLCLRLNVGADNILYFRRDRRVPSPMTYRPDHAVTPVNISLVEDYEP